MLSCQFSVLEAAQVIDKELATETTYRRVVRTITHPADATTRDQMRIVEASGAIDFWNSPEENIYGDNDGDAA